MEGRIGVTEVGMVIIALIYIAHTTIYVKAVFVGECAMINPRSRIWIGRIDLRIRRYRKTEKSRKGKKKCVAILYSG